jgi:hypothetical protein
MLSAKILPLLLALQQQGFTTPPSGDTTGYWQQRADYRISAILDEGAGMLRGRGELTYTNNSPDTLRELYLHQHLNAFRPGSMWSRDDEREGRVRFQNLADPHQGFERLTSAPLIDGIAVRAEYPYAPDSTVVRLVLPTPLPPGGSVRVELDWTARPSTVPRRQGRRGRHWDFAHWYPRIAVYDRGGWQHNPLRVAGEFYGEFGAFDVTLIVRDDQVLGSTGVPIEGDPGWGSVHRGGDIVLARDAYAGAVQPARPPAFGETGADIPAGYRAVRWVARDVHHFAWSASPDYRYEGAAYVRPRMRSAVPHWDTVAVHVLYRPGDEATWGNGIAVQRTLTALSWLESIFGPYAYPQVTNLHRLDGGGTEFPMVMMNGSPSQGLILHELAHIYIHGILANNEWRSGWIDEGLASYLTNWAQGLTPHERARQRDTIPPRTIEPGYAGNALRMTRADSISFAAHLHDIRGTAEPMGTVSHEFSEFGIYNAMIYARAERMFSHLRDLIGDEAFVAFHRDLYERWHYRHVDELALRRSAERASGRDLRWFFEQWVHSTGMLDYALRDAESRQMADGGWLTTAVIERRGDYSHAMPIGVRTADGWTIARGDPTRDSESVEIITATQPLEVRLDPYRITADWDRRNDVLANRFLGDIEVVFDWPFLAQTHRERTVVALSPILWYSAPGGLTLGARARTNYGGVVDRWDAGLALATRAPAGASPLSRLQPWLRVENPYLPSTPRPLHGVAAGAAYLDGILKLDVSRRQELSPTVIAPGPRVELLTTITGAFPFDSEFLPEQWADAPTFDVAAELRARRRLGSTGIDSLRGRAGAMVGLIGSETVTAQRSRVFLRAEIEATGVSYSADTATVLAARAFAGFASNAPAQRALYASVRDPVSTFENHWYRPRDAILKQDAINYLPLGGAALRGYSPALALNGALAGNLEAGRRVARFSGQSHALAVWGVAFADVAVAAAAAGIDLGDPILADAGVGLSLRGRLYDRALNLRLDAPILVHHPEYAFDRQGRRMAALRWSVTMNEIW